MKARNDFSWLLLRLGPMRWRIVLGLVCVSLAGLAATIDSLLMRALIDDSLPRRNLRWALELAGGIGLCYFGRSALSAMASQVLRGIPNDTPILGYHTNTANTMRLWPAQAVESFDFGTCNTGDYLGAMADKVSTENNSKTLYPESWERREHFEKRARFRPHAHASQSCRR